LGKKDPYGGGGYNGLKGASNFGALLTVDIGTTYKGDTSLYTPRVFPPYIGGGKAQLLCG